MYLNIEILNWMLTEIENCERAKRSEFICPGDSGELPCIICKNNVLSTEELKLTNWSDLRGETID